VVNDRGYVWIGDFGVSHLEDDETSANKLGTVRYAAPEQCEAGMVCTTKCDVFAFGLVLYEWLVGVPVFPPSEYRLHIVQHLRDGDLPGLPTKHGELMQTVIGQFWKRDPMMRPTFDETLDMFAVDNYEILPGCNRAKVRNFAEKVLKWEFDARTFQANRASPVEGSD
jgi:serine/threonine protein kinase